MATKVRKTAEQMPGDPTQLGLDLQAALVEEPAASAQVAAPATPVLSAFSRLVTGAAVAMGIEQAFAGKPSSKASQADSKIKAAWALATEPAKLAALSMASLGKVHSNTYDSSSDWNWMSQGALAGFSEPELEVLWAGAQELCEKIKGIGESDAMVEAARAGSRLMVNAASRELLSYPALGVGLAPGSSILEGKKTPTVNGVKLRWAGSASKNERNNGQEALMTAEDWALRLGGAEQAAPWMDEIKQGIDFGKSAPGNPWADFAAWDAKEAAAQSYLSGEVPLPSSASYAEAMQAAFSATTPGKLAAEDFTPKGDEGGHYYGYAHQQSASLGHRDVTPRAEYTKSRSAAVASTLVSGWSWAISVALAPEAAKAAPRQARGNKLGISSGPFGQIDGGKLEGATKDGWQEAIPKKVLDRIGVAIESNYGRTDDALAVPRAMASALAKAVEHAGKVDGLPTAIKLAEELSKSVFGKDAHSGSKFEAKAKALSKADASLGLLQLLGSLQLLRAGFESTNNRYRNEPVAPKPVSVLTARLESSLDALAQSMDVARRAYGAAGVEHAAGVERSWMALHGLDKAWDQAGQAGARSPKSIGWAMANPIGESLASENPMARLAAQAARGLGLRAKAGEGELVASLVEELGEFGASQAAIQALPSQPKMREILADLASNLAGADKKKAHASRQALFFAVHAMNAAVALDMPGPELERFAADYLVEDPVPAHQHRYNQERKFDLFMAGATGSDGRFDGMGPGLSAFEVVDVDQAKLAGDVCRAKVQGYPKFIESLAADWRDSTQRAMDLGQGQQAAWVIAAERAKEVRAAYPKHAMIDWRKKPFEGSALWQVFKMPSPRFSAAAADAVAKGGDLGLWCSQRARRLGVDDASDGNDLVGRSRDKIKQRCQMSDGAWKLAIKDPSILTVLTVDLRLNPEDRNHAIDSASLSDAACLDKAERSTLIRRVPGDSQDERIHADGPKSAGIALKAATVGGISPATVGVALQGLTGHGRAGGRGRLELFADNIASVVASGAEGADFFVAEAAEKAARMPKIFIECCKRYEKLVADAAKEEARALAAPAHAEQAEGREVRGGRFDPLERFNDEIGDLCDWIGKSEHGLWTEMPKDPTFGQLSRMSKAWHDEQAAMAIDKADRQRVARAVADAVHEADASANPFAVTSGSRWGKIIGRHARDGWEAVEMLSASELTEEGATMHHCVSSYSPNCRSGESRIFSVRLNGERKCTLQVQGASVLSKLDEANLFRITQNKGPSNQAVNNAGTLAFCNEVLEKVNSTWPAVIGKIKKARDSKAEDKKDVVKKAKEAELAKIEAERIAPAPKM